MARDRPDIPCAEIPLELLEAAAFSGEEPFGFIEEFLRVGHESWLTLRFGHRVFFDREQMDRAVLLLWLRACELYTSRVFGHPDMESNQPFFSDEGLLD